MAVACFIRSVDGVENLGDDTYRVSVSCSLMDTSNSTFSTTFDAVGGSDWRIQARTAASVFALEHLGETVSLCILPNLETI
jgi:hypothetical protein